VVTNDFTMTRVSTGQPIMNGLQDWSIGGDVIQTGAGGSPAWNKGSGTITANGSGSQSWDFGGLIIEAVIIDKTSGTTTFGNGLVAQSITIIDPGTAVDFSTYTHDFFDGWTGQDQAGVDYSNASVYALGHLNWPLIGGATGGAADVEEFLFAQETMEGGGVAGGAAVVVYITQTTMEGGGVVGGAAVVIFLHEAAFCGELSITSRYAGELSTTSRYTATLSITSRYTGQLSTTSRFTGKMNVG
jgi:hypothetical protein